MHGRPGVIGMGAAAQLPMQELLAENAGAREEDFTVSVDIQIFHRLRINGGLIILAGQRVVALYIVVAEGKIENRCLVEAETFLDEDPAFFPGRSALRFFVIEAEVSFRL